LLLCLLFSFPGLLLKGSLLFFSLPSGAASFTLHLFDLTALLDFLQAVLSAALSLSLQLLLLALMKLLILGQGLLPLESRNALVFLVDLEALEVLIDFGLLELEVNADLGELLLFQGGRYEVLNLGLLANDKVVLVLGQLLLVVFRGFAVIFLL
jgi:hypothetical protein